MYFIFLASLLSFPRIVRIIRQERGNALLVGVGGTGKQSLTRLASHICGYKCFQIELSRGYNYSSFHDDLKSLYMMAGVDNQDTVFLFTDTQVCKFHHTWGVSKHSFCYFFLFLYFHVLLENTSKAVAFLSKGLYTNFNLHC